MNTLCSTCQSKQAQHFLGTCQKCNTVTTSFNYQLCDTCAEQLQECKWCRTPLGAGSHSSVAAASTVLHVVKRDADNGCNIKGMNIGEQVHISLEEDQYSGKEWGIKSTSYGIGNPSGSTFAPDPQDPQYGTRTFVFDLYKSGSFTIELHEVSRYYGWGWGGGGGSTPVQNGKTWKCTVQVK